MPASLQTPRLHAGRALSILAAALLLCWPAFWNRSPLYLSDSNEYLRDGRLVALQIVQHGWATFAETRSEMYSLGILLVDQDRSPWPVVALQAALTAWILWLVIRSLAASIPIRRPTAFYLGLVATLSFFTSVGWYVSYLTPDILGPVLYLCLYLLVFAAEDLRRWEAVAVFVIAWWATTAHATHLVLAAAVSGLLCLLWMLRWQGIRHRGRRLLLVLSILLLAVVTQISLHGWIYHRASLFGHRPPFLMARFLGDGPARLYLQQNCPTLQWMICKHVDNLPTSDAAFLWQPGGIWLSTPYPQQESLAKEEMPLVLGTLRTHPLAQAQRSLSNFLHQLILMGPHDFTSEYLPPPALDTTLPGIYEDAQTSRQAHDALPQEFFRKLQGPVILASALAILMLLPSLWRGRQLRLLGLTSIILFVVPANAFVTGVLSGVYARYQGRIAWLVLLAAALLAAAYWTSSRQPASPDVPQPGT